MTAGPPREGPKPGEWGRAPDYEVTPFCYVLVKRVTGVGWSWLSNDTDLTDLLIDVDESLDGAKDRETAARMTDADWKKLEERRKAYIFGRIEELYGVDLSDLPDTNCARVAGELERRLEWKKYGGTQ